MFPWDFMDWGFDPRPQNGRTKRIQMCEEHLGHVCSPAAPKSPNVKILRSEGRELDRSFLHKSGYLRETRCLDLEHKYRLVSILQANKPFGPFCFKKFFHMQTCEKLILYVRAFENVSFTNAPLIRFDKI